MERAYVTLVLTVTVAAAGAAASCGNGGDAPAATKDVGPDASTIPEVCRTIGDRSRCPFGTHLEPRTPPAQLDCVKGVAERRCGEARFLYEKCLDEHPLCLDDGSGLPTSDDPLRCAVDRARWGDCRADAGT